jgi:hypothetical protein
MKNQGTRRKGSQRYRCFAHCTFVCLEIRAKFNKCGNPRAWWETKR